jgi:hypothetical protein
LTGSTSSEVASASASERPETILVGLNPESTNIMTASNHHNAEAKHGPSILLAAKVLQALGIVPTVALLFAQVDFNIDWAIIRKSWRCRGTKCAVIIYVIATTRRIG